MNNSKHFEVHLQKDSNEGVVIQIVYTGLYGSELNEDKWEDDFTTGSITVGIKDYENLLKALNKARKYVHNLERNDPICVPFRLERESE